MRRRIKKISVNPKTFGSLNEQSNVKMIQLFLNTETEPEFKKMAQALQEKFGINNITDLMFKILKERYDSEV